MLDELQDRLNKTIESTSSNLGTIRTGRANPEILSRLQVSYYGSMVPLQQVASVSVGDPTMLQLNVFDKTVVQEVEKAIQKSELGLNPQVDGTLIRLRLPELTEERRIELTKVVKKYVEDGKVAARNIRRDYIDKVKKEEKDGDLTEDDVKRFQDDIQKIVDASIAKLDSMNAEKEKELLKV